MMKSYKFGIIHAIAYCENCNWSEGIKLESRNRMQELRRKITQHIKETKHSISLETGNSTRYSYN